MPIKANCWVVIFSAALLFFYNFMQLNILNPITQYLLRDFNITAAQLGNMSSIYFYINCLMVIPAGLMLDRFSPRKLILMAMIVTILGVFCFAYAPDTYVAGIGRALMGFGGGFCFVGPMSIAARWVSSKQLAFVVGCLITMCMLGGLMAQTPMTIAVHVFGWRHAMLLDGVLGLVCFIPMFLFIANRPAYAIEQAKNAKPIPFWRSLSIVMFNKRNWLAGLYTAFMNLPIFLLGALWGVLYLTQVDNLSATQASYVTAMLFVGSIFGSPLIGWLSDRLQKRQLIMLISALIACVSIVLIIYVSGLTLWALMLLFLVLGIITSAQALSYPIVTEINPPTVTATANSIVSTTLIASGFIFQPFFGWLMGLHDKPTLWNHVMHFSRADFRYGMLIMPVAFFVSILIAGMLKEKTVRQ